MIEFERLMDEHDRLSMLAATFVQAVGDSALDIDSLLLLRTDLATELASHLYTEDGHIYPKLIHAADHGAARAARLFLEQFEHLAADWQNYLAGWPRDAIAADSAGFANETRMIMARLLHRIDQENQLLYPLALRAGVVRLRMQQAA